MNNDNTVFTEAQINVSDSTCKIIKTLDFCDVNRFFKFSLQM